MAPTNENEPLINKQDGCQQLDTKFKIWKDLMCFSFSFFLVVTGYVSLQNLESSLNSVAGLGVASVACVYVGVASVGMIAPFLFYHMQSKISLICCFIAHVIFLASNAYPRFYTLIPASVILGTSCAPMFVCIGTYITILSDKYANLLAVNINSIIGRFNGIFFMALQAA
jgi:hypothetical protein